MVGLSSCEGDCVLVLCRCLLEFVVLVCVGLVLCRRLRSV